ncbi:MAG: ATPase [Terasakiella sp.]
MTARITTVTFQGIDVIEVEVQVSITTGLPALKNVGTVGGYKN